MGRGQLGRAQHQGQVVGRGSEMGASSDLTTQMGTRRLILAIGPIPMVSVDYAGEQARHDLSKETVV